MLAIEGAAAADFGGGASSATIPVTTGGTDRIIIAHISTERNGSPRRTVTSVAASGLAFAKREDLDVGDGYGTSVEVWWAYAAAQQTALTITTTMSGGIDSGTLAVLAVSGVQNFTNPWTANSSVPKTAVDTGASSPVQVTGVSTTEPNCIVFGFYGGETGSTPNAETTPTAFTQAYARQNWGGSRHSSIWAEYYIFSSAQASITVGSASSTLSNWGMIADAITDATPPLTGTWASTEAPDTFAAAGSPIEVVTWASTEAKDVFAAIGYANSITGIWASLETKDTFAGAGLPNPAGYWTSTEAKDVFAAAGYQQIGGSWTSTEARDVFSAYGRQPLGGTWSSTEAKDVFAAVGTTHGESGVWASTEPVDVVNMIGYIPNHGSWASTEAKDAFFALAYTIGAAPKGRRIFLSC